MSGGALICILPVAFFLLPSAPETPQAAVAALRKALEANDLAALAQLVPGPNDAALRTLAGPMAKAQAAGARVDAALKEQPSLNFANPFAASLTPFAGLTVELVETGKDAGRNFVRVKVSTKDGAAHEEVLGLVSEGAGWRIGLPADLARQLRRLQDPPEELQREAERLAALADVLEKLAADLDKKQLKTREAALLRLAQLVAESKLAEEPKKKEKSP